MLPQLYRHRWMDEDIEAFRDQVRRYVVGELVPQLDGWRRQGYIPRQVWRPFGQMGFLLPELSENMVAPAPRWPINWWCRTSWPGPRCRRTPPFT